eukprot:3119376-Amphidinium_carterae.1
MSETTRTVETQAVTMQNLHTDAMHHIRFVPIHSRQFTIACLFRSKMSNPSQNGKLVLVLILVLVVLVLVVAAVVGVMLPSACNVSMLVRRFDGVARLS